MKQEPLLKRVLPIVMLLLAFCLNMHAQGGISIKGTVVDKNNESIIGASVVVKGKGNVGTVSDLSGNFALTVPSANSVIVVSYI